MLPGIYWAWAENVLAEEPYEYKDPGTNEVDINQNSVVNVHLGFSNYGYLTYYQKMGDLLKQKKLLQMRANKADDPDQKTKLKRKIDLLQKKAKSLLSKVESYKKSNEAEATYVYIQFMSMNAREKFLRGFEVPMA